MSGLSTWDIKRLILTLSSFPYFLVIYLVKDAMMDIPSQDISWRHVLGAICLMAVALLWGRIGLLFCYYFREEPLDISKIDTIEAANDNYLVNYIGFFLIATDMNDYVTLGVVFLFLLYLVYKSNVSYFNPAFLVFGYKFYVLTTDLKTRIILITKQTIKKPEDILASSDSSENETIVQVRKINEYVFIQWDEN